MIVCIFSIEYVLSKSVLLMTNVWIQFSPSFLQGQLVRMLQPFDNWEPTCDKNAEGTGSEPNKEGIAYYNKVIDGLLQKGSISAFSELSWFYIRSLELYWDFLGQRKVIEVLMKPCTSAVMHWFFHSLMLYYCDYPYLSQSIAEWIWKLCCVQE